VKPFSLHHKFNWIFSFGLPSFEQNQSGRLLSMAAREKSHAMYLQILE
jgi:hypothetical protein